MADAEFPDWTDDLRMDGLRVMRLEGEGERFRIDSGRGETLDVCPCCSKSLPNARAAKLVADVVFPLVRR
jgi:hypothetical protein